MASLANGQCAHRWPDAGRCLELAVTTRPMRRLSMGDVVYEVPLCEDHAAYYDHGPVRV